MKRSLILAALACLVAPVAAQLTPKPKLPPTPDSVPPLLNAPAAPPKAESAAGVIRIGHVAPLSGGIGHLGLDNERGARLAVEEINAAGGLRVGGRVYRLQLIGLDDAADPRTAVRVAQDIAYDSKVTAVVGHLNSGTSIPAAKIYFDARVPHISPSATNPKLTQMGFDTSFRIVANDEHQGTLLGWYAVNALKAKRIAIIDDRTAYGEGLAKQFEATVKRLGAEVVAREFGDDKRTDFRSIVLNIEVTTPDLVFYGGMDATAAPLAQQMRRQGMQAVLLGGDGTCSPEFIKIAKGASEPMHCGMAGEAVETLAGGEQFKARFKRRFTQDVQIYAPYSYDAVYVIADALKRAGTTQSDALIRALRTTNDYPGLTGNIRFDARGDIIGGAISIFRVKNGRLEYISMLR